MRYFKYVIYYFIISLVYIKNIQANTYLTIPSELETEELNKDEKQKFQSIQYNETLAMPQQYKGELKHKEGVEEIYLKDVRLYLGFGGRYSFLENITLSADKDPPDTTYYTKTHHWKYDPDFNYYASVGLYWRNGIRIDFEYSQSVFESEDYGNSFNRYQYNNIIFNQYLQTTGVLTTKINTQTDKTYTILTDNMYPITELTIKTYMINFIMERVYSLQRIKPYLGVGVGILEGDMTSLVSDKASRVPAIQVMLGISYPITKDDSVILYLGYRGIFAKELEQTFTRITGVSFANVPDNERVEADRPFNGTSYYNPVFVKSKERYSYKTNNIDFGFKVFL